MSFTGQINFGYPLTSNNIITTVPDNAVLPLSIGSSLQGNILGVTFGDLKSQIAPTFTNCNIAFGEDALSSITTGEKNVGIGCKSLENNTTGDNNIAIGYNVLNSNVTGYDNNGFGLNALRSNTTGTRNLAIGNTALDRNTTGDANVAIGYGAMSASTVSNLNVAIGVGALERGTGSGNTAIGYSAGQFNEGFANIAIGYSALRDGFSAASYNIAIGNNSFYRITTGAYNIGIGEFSMSFCQTGNYNVALGYYADSQNFSGSVILGANAQATANNQFVVGSTTYNAGSIATETITSNRTWTVRINGANYKIPLLAI